MYIGNLKKIFVVVFIIGCIGLSLAVVLQVLRSPYLITVSIAAMLLGAIGILDRRVKLTLLDSGVRYAQWGPVVIPWAEFSAYRWVIWRKSPYLQLVPLHPSRVLESFSMLGKLNHRLAGMIGAPEFSIVVTPLAISDAQLAEGVAEYLPESD